MGRLLGGLPSFRHGVHPPDEKVRTAALPLGRMPFVERYVLLCGMHIGAPARPCVAKGDRVTRGQVVAQPGGFVSAAIHSPVDGEVVAVDQRRHPDGRIVEAIELEADPYSDQRLPEPSATDALALDRDAFVASLQRSGIVGLGGAAFPSHVKYALPPDKTCRWLVLNGCECEPWLTADHRVMVESAGKVIRGARLLAASLEAAEVIIGVEANKPDAVEALRKAAAAEETGSSSARSVPLGVRAVEVKYPQGAEKMLVKALLGVEVPAGRLPLDIGVVVQNVGTAAATAAWFEQGHPLVERVVTVSGTAVRRPANLIVPIGTPVADVIRHCGGLTDEARYVVLGGPMMGTPIADLDVPVLKGTSGILAWTERDAAVPREYPCIRCGRCLEACPYFLHPSRYARLAKVRRWEELEAWSVMDCVECGSCTFACPSNIPIVHLIRTAKAVIREGRSAT